MMIIAWLVIWSFICVMFGYMFGKIRAYSLLMDKMSEKENEVWEALYGKR